MSSKPAAVIVLVCPTCGKKYRGDANRPGAKYQCAADKTPLVRDVPPLPASEAIAESTPPNLQNGAAAAAAPAPEADAPASSTASEKPTQLDQTEEEATAGRSWLENVISTV